MWMKSGFESASAASHTMLSVPKKIYSLTIKLKEMIYNSSLSGQLGNRDTY